MTLGRICLAREGVEGRGHLEDEGEGIMFASNPLCISSNFPGHCGGGCVQFMFPFSVAAHQSGNLNLNSVQLIVRAGLDVLSSRICDPLWTEIYCTLEASFLLEGHRLQRLEIQAHPSFLASPLLRLETAA